MKKCSMSLITRKMQIKTKWDAISHPSEWLSSVNQQTTSVVEDVGKRELLCTVGGIVNWCSHYGKSMEVPQKIKNRTII